MATLPTLACDRSIQVSKLPGLVLVTFGGRGRPPCTSEPPRLQAFTREHQYWCPLLVATDPPQEAHVFLQQRGITLTTLKGGTGVTTAMHRAGNRTGGLPFTVAMSGGRLCGVHEGVLRAEALEVSRAVCEHTAPSP